MADIGNYIDGRWHAPAAGKWLDNFDPSTGEVYGRVAASDETDVQRAVEAAERAFPAWSNTPAAERSRILLRLADLIDQNLDRLAMAECVDNGKPLRLAHAMDIPRAALNFRFFATAILHTHSEVYSTDRTALNFTLREPRGVVGLISPWNLPLYLFSWKVAPAIAAGNTAVAKPSEVTPMTAHMLTELCEEAGLPPGVLNVVHGYGPDVGGPMTSHPKIGTLSFTGGTVTGATIAKTAAPMFKKLSLELGGKNPNIIFADADMEKVGESVRAGFANQGQICLCGSRIFVEQSAYDAFVDAYVGIAKSLKVGDPLEPDTNQGAIVSKAQLEKVAYYVSLAKEEGGEILCGGGPPETPVSDRCKDGFFFRPTVIAGLPFDARVNQEEIFGPVVTITPFDGEDQVIEYANSTDYGLSASVWTENLSRAHRVAHAVKSGTVWVNCWLIRDLRVPFGGMKQSGVGREGGDEALRFFTETKNVCVKL